MEDSELYKYRFNVEYNFYVNDKFIRRNSIPMQSNEMILRLENIADAIKIDKEKEYKGKTVKVEILKASLLKKNDT